MYFIALFGAILVCSVGYAWFFWCLPRVLFPGKPGYFRRVAIAHSVVFFVLYGMWGVIYVAIH